MGPEDEGEEFLELRKYVKFVTRQSTKKNSAPKHVCPVCGGELL